MDCIVNEPDPVCAPFFDKFADLWSRPNQSQCFAAYVGGLLARMDRKNVEAISNRTAGQAYQGLHHFLTESPWDGAELNRRRVQLMQAAPRTRSRPEGVLILDDSGVPKKGEATQGVKRQYIGQLGKVANGQVFVTSHYAEGRCHWPVDLLPYVPDNWLAGGKADPAFRTKLELALELADRAVGWGLSFRAVVADAWYGRNAVFIKGLECVWKISSCDRSRAGAQTSQHQVAHGQVYPGFLALGKRFVVFAQAPGLAQPCKCALHHPAARQHLEPASKRFLHDLDSPARPFAHPILESATVGGVCPELFQSRPVL